MEKKAANLSSTVAVLALILAVSAVLRFWGIDSESLWNDELSSWKRSNFETIGEVLERGSKPDVHPPGFQFLLFFVMQNFGDSELVLRLPSALAGILAVLFTYLIGTRLYTNREGLTAAAVMAVSWSAVLYSQEARSYSWLLVTSSAAFYFWYDIIRTLMKNETLSTGTTIGYLVFATASCYLHYFGLLFVVLQAGYGLLLFSSNPKALGKWVALLAVGLMLYLPWIPSFLDQMAAHKESWIGEPDILGMFQALVRFAYKMPLWLFALAIVPAYLYLAARRGPALLREWKEERSPGKLAIAPDVLLVLWIVVPFVTSYIQSVISTPVLTNRNLIILLPPIYLLLARGVWMVRIRGFAAAWSLALVLGVLFSLIVYGGYYQETKKEQFREAAAFVIEKDGISSTQPIIAFTWSKQYFEYYFQNMKSTHRVSMLAGKEDDIPKLRQFLETSGAEEFWFLSGHRIPEQGFIEYLEDNYVKEEEVILKEASARKFRL